MEDERTAHLATDEQKRNDIHTQWPQVVQHDLKDKVLRLFREQTSKATLATFTCAVCAEASLCSFQKKMRVADIDDLSILKLKLSHAAYNVPIPYQYGPLKDVIIDPAGVETNEGDLTLLLCKPCHSALKKKKLPALALANSTYLGPVPKELKDLTVIEEAMIAHCRAKCWIVQLKEENKSVDTPDSQRGVKGHIIILKNHQKLQNYYHQI